MKLLAAISARFVNLPAHRIDDEINDALRTICTSHAIDNSTIYQISDNAATMVTTHVFQQTLPPAVPKDLNAASDFPWCLKKILNNEVICLADTQKAPPEACTDMASWKRSNIGSTLVFPLSVGNSGPFGAWSLNCKLKKRAWPERLHQRLRIIADIFANALLRKYTERTLLDTELRLKLATQNAHIAFWTLNVFSGELWATPQSREIFRFDPKEELTYEKYIRTIHPEDVSRVQSVIDTVLETGQGECEYRVIWPDGTVRWVRSLGGLSSQAVGGARPLTGITFDITEQKRTEEELRRREWELQQAQRIAEVGNLTWDSHTGSVTWSDEMYQIHGRDPSLPPPSFDELEHCFTTESWNRLLTIRNEWLRTGCSSTLDLELVREDGSTRWVSFKGEAERDADGEIVLLRGTVQDITERKATEERLREYEHTIENADQMIAVVDSDYRYVIANQSFISALGKQRNEVVGRHVWEVLPKDVFERTLKPHLDRSFRGEVVRYEMKFSYPRRGERDTSISYFPLEGVDGGHRIVCFWHDITERHMKDEALRESEERYRSLVESSHDWIWEVDSEARYTFVGPQSFKVLGYRPEEILGKTPFDLMPEPEAARIRETFDAVTKEHKPFRNLENINRCKDGRHVVLETNGVPIFDKNGKFVGYRGMDRDITERKRTEEALVESEQKFLKLFRTAPIVIYLSTLDGNIVDVNDAFEVITGYTSQETVGRTAEELQLWAEPIQSEYIGSRLVEDRRVRDIEQRFRKKSGEMHTGLLSANLIDISGKTLVLTTVKDITEQKIAETNLRDLSRRLINAQEEERKRIARELHDNISQHLALLSFAIEQIAKTELTDDTRDSLHKVLNKTKSLSSDVQALSHQLHSASLDILGLAAGIDSFRREFAKSHQVTIQFVHSGVPNTIPGELSLALFRITQEALNNAVKYSGARDFKVALIGTADQVELTIRDPGVGFDVEAVMPRGLGLTSMRERILPFNGTISIVSKPMQGTEITVRIPLSHIESQSMGVAPPVSVPG